MDTIGCNLGVIYICYDGFSGNPLITPLDIVSNSEDIYVEEPDYDLFYYEDDQEEI